MVGSRSFWVGAMGTAVLVGGLITAVGAAAALGAQGTTGLGTIQPRHHSVQHDQLGLKPDDARR